MPSFLENLHFNLGNLIFDKSANDNYKEFLTIFKLCTNEFFPLKVVKQKKCLKAKYLMTAGIKVSSENKRRLHSLAKSEQGA